MVVVLQAFAEGEDGDGPVVGAVVVGLERLATDHVAHRSDAPGSLVGQENPRQPTKQETTEGRIPGAANRAADESRKRQAEHDPQAVGAVVEEQFAVGEDIRRKEIPARQVPGQHPRHMRIPDTAQATEQSRAVQVGRMRIAVLIAVGVVAAMGGDPEHDRPLGRYRAADQQQSLEKGRGAECLVGQIAMEAHRDAAHVEEIEDAEQHHVGSRHAPFQRALQRHRKSSQRHQHDHQRSDLLDDGASAG